MVRVNVKVVSFSHLISIKSGARRLHGNDGRMIEILQEREAFKAPMEGWLQLNPDIEEFRVSMSVRGNCSFHTSTCGYKWNEK